MPLYFCHSGEYNKLFEKANKLAREMMDLVDGRDSEGFILLKKRGDVSRAKEIDDAIHKLQSFLFEYRPKVKAITHPEKESNKRYFEADAKLEEVLNKLVEIQKSKYK